MNKFSAKKDPRNGKVRALKCRVTATSLLFIMDRAIVDITTSINEGISHYQ